jgi:hypothetical protein
MPGLVVSDAGMLRDDVSKEGFGLGERARPFLESLSRRDPKRDRVGVVGDMVNNAGCVVVGDDRKGSVAAG